jgi:hypothetical protein
MRLAALVLVLFGAVVLGSWAFAPAAGGGGPAGRTGLLSPLAGGIVLVSGLLLLIGASRRTDTGTP